MRILLLSAMTIFVMGTANAQTTKFGVKAGGNIAWLNGDGELSKPVPGFHAGAFAELKITEKFSLQPELLFSIQGGRDKKEAQFNMNYSKEEMKITLGYLNVPVLAKYYVASGFSIDAGPQVGINLYARQRFDYFYNINGGITTAKGSQDVRETVKSLDLGLALGTSCDLNDHLFLQARYVFGLTSVHKEVHDEFGNYSADIRNGVGQISVGYRF